MSSCDAGSGCSISCSGGCAAIYWHDTGECYTACYNTKAAPIAAALSGTLSIAVCEMPAGALAGLLAQTALGPRLAGLLRSSAPTLSSWRRPAPRMSSRRFSRRLPEARCRPDSRGTA